MLVWREKHLLVFVDYVVDVVVDDSVVFVDVVVVDSVVFVDVVVAVFVVAFVVLVMFVLSGYLG